MSLSDVQRELFKTRMWF